MGSEVEEMVDIGLAKDGSGVGGKYHNCTKSLMNLASSPLFLSAALCALEAVKQLRTVEETLNNLKLGE